MNIVLKILTYSKKYYIYDNDNDIQGKKVGSFKTKGTEIDAWKKDFKEDVVYAKEPNGKKRYFYKKTKKNLMGLKLGEYDKKTK